MFLFDLGLHVNCIEIYPKEVGSSHPVFWGASCLGCLSQQLLSSYKTYHRHRNARSTNLVALTHGSQEIPTLHLHEFKI